jgi:hypothetical protein
MAINQKSSMSSGYRALLERVTNSLSREPKPESKLFVPDTTGREFDEDMAAKRAIMSTSSIAVGQGIEDSLTTSHYYTGEKFLQLAPTKFTYGPVPIPFEIAPIPTEPRIKEPEMSTKPEETKVSANPKDLLGIKKVQLNLVPMSSIVYQALAMQDGAKKYGPYNWRANKVIASIYIAACMRHLGAWYDAGEELAEDSQKPHLAHALACIGIIVDALETGNLVDDRPIPGATVKLLDKWEVKKQ